MSQVSGKARADAKRSTSEIAGGSPLRSYQDLAVGSRSLLGLVRYELLATWGARLPGAAGLLFRQLTWPRLVGRCGRKTAWGHGVVLRHPANMWFGERVLVDDGCYLDAKGCEPGQFRIEDESLISRGCVLSGKYGALRVGPRANIGASCAFYAFEHLEIGADTMLGAFCFVGGGSYDARGSVHLPLAQQMLPGRGVVIEEDCWLGAGVVVVDGVRIGRGSVVGAGAVVTRDLPPFSIAVGVPARVVGTRQAEASEAGGAEAASEERGSEPWHQAGRS